MEGIQGCIDYMANASMAFSHGVYTILFQCATSPSCSQALSLSIEIEFEAVEQQVLEDGRGESIYFNLID